MLPRALLLRSHQVLISSWLEISASLVSVAGDDLTAFGGGLVMTFHCPWLMRKLCIIGAQDI